MAGRVRGAGSHTAVVSEDLSSARFLLRAYRPDELPAFLELALDPRVTRLVGDGRPWTTARATARFAAGLTAHRDEQGLWLTVRDRTDGQQVGLVAVTAHGSQAEVGIWVSPARWSTGVGAETLLAVLREIKTRFPHHSPTAEADVRHVASDRLLRRVGFQRHQRGTGRYGNDVWFYAWDGPEADADPSR